MVGDRFKLSDHFKYIHTWIEMAGGENSNFPKALDDFQRYLQQANEIQNQRPRLYRRSEQKDFVKMNKLWKHVL
ncbi:MAG: hypothetical protein R3E91_00925 [Chlamydiales bacterium]